MEYRGGGPHPRGPPNRLRENHNFQQHNNSRMMNPYSNFPANSNFQGPEEGIVYQNQSHGGVAPPPPPMPMEFTNFNASGYIAQNLPSPNNISAAYPGFQTAWPMTGPVGAVGQVYLEMPQVPQMQTFIAATPPPAPAPTPTLGAPPGMAAGPKFNNIEMVALCSQCKQKNHVWLMELKNKDDVINNKEVYIKSLSEQIDQLNDQARAMQNKIRELEDIVAQNRNESVVQEEALAKSQLSPEAISFTPSVPVVSAKGIADEPTQSNQDTTVESDQAEESANKPEEPICQTDSYPEQQPSPVSTPDNVSQVKSWADEAEQETTPSTQDTKLSVETSDNAAQLVVPEDTTPALKIAEDNWNESPGHYQKPVEENYGYHHRENRQHSGPPRFQQSNEFIRSRKQFRGERAPTDSRPPGFGRGRPMEHGPQYQYRTEDTRSYHNQNNLRNNEGNHDFRHSGPRDNQRRDFRDNKSKDNNIEATKHTDDTRGETSNTYNNASGDAKEIHENWRSQRREEVSQSQTWDHRNRSQRENQRGSYSGAYTQDQPTRHYDQHSRNVGYQHGNHLNYQNRPYQHSDQHKPILYNQHGNNQGNFNLHPSQMQPYGQQGHDQESQQNRGMNRGGRGFHSDRRSSYNQGHQRHPRNRVSEDRQSTQDFDSNATGEQNSVKAVVKDVVEILKGDLFSAPKEYSLAHCVAKDFRMGSGIAVKFRVQFKQVSELMDQNQDVGGCAVIKDPENDRHIFYLVTKSVSNGKPAIDDLQRSLETMREKCKLLGVTKLAMPRIGCGLDSLNWEDVKFRINEVFMNENIEIRVYDFNVDGKPEEDKPASSTRVVHKEMRLANMEEGTALLFFGSEDGVMDDTATKIDESLKFAMDYKKAKKICGKVYRCDKTDKGFIIYGLIVTKKGIGKFTFVHLYECLKEMVKYLRKDRYQYLAIEATKAWVPDDITFTEKTVTLLRFMLPKTVNEIWVCYPDKEADPFNMVAKFEGKHREAQGSKE